MADGDCWISFVANARNNQGDPHQGASVSLEWSRYSSGVVVHNFDRQPQPATTSSLGYAYLWAASTVGEYEIGVRAVATGGGRTVRSGWTTVTFPAGQWETTFLGSVGSGSGNWYKNGDGGLPYTQFFVNSVEITSNGEIRYVDGEDYLGVSCMAYALRTRPLPLQLKARAWGDGTNTVTYEVEWDGSSHYPPYPAPPGFEFRCRSTAYAEGNHSGIGQSQATAGAEPQQASVLVNDDDGWDADTVTPIFGETQTGGSQPVRPTITLAAWCQSIAEPEVVDLGATGTANGQHTTVGCDENHEHVLNNYPAP
jgi:hypothetical protein